ncbi:MAG: phage tail terminator protein [Pseudomonadota bacterium]
MLELIVARLLASAQGLTAVEIAEDIEAMADRAGLVESGSAIVMPYREAAEPNVLATGGHRQRVRVQFLTGIVIRHYDDAMGAERAKAFDSLKAAVEAALTGWEPDPYAEPCALVSGESSPVTAGVSIYVQTWETARYLTGA